MAETANEDLDEAFAREHLKVVPRPYVMLAVSDSGKGMDEALAPAPMVNGTGTVLLTEDDAQVRGIVRDVLVAS